LEAAYHGTETPRHNLTEQEMIPQNMSFNKSVVTWYSQISTATLLQMRFFISIFNLETSTVPWRQFKLCNNYFQQPIDLRVASKIDGQAKSSSKSVILDH
jgi:hypothetical protein